MKLHVLGCHGPYPMANGATSGYLLETENDQILLDCGSGVLGRLIALCDPAKLSCVMLSHLHFDHMADMLVLQYYLQQAGKKLTVYVPPEDDSPQKALLRPAVFDIRPYPETLEMNGLKVTTLPVRHPVPCRALRFEEKGRVFVFTGDTNTCPGLAAFAGDADVLMTDTAFLADEWDEKKPHLSAALGAALAKEAGAKRLLLTHLPVRHAPETLEAEARAVCPGAQAVFPGMTVII